jgi:hypothetical protein
MTDPIRIPVHVSDGNFRWHCHAEVTPEIARQIVALAGMDQRIDAIYDSLADRIREGLDLAKRVAVLAEPASAVVGCQSSYDSATILFQNGPISEKGVNGITQEVLLAIVADRLRSFQAGPFACRENALALTKIEEAQHWLQQRTLSRMRRGVEGTHEK